MNPDSLRAKIKEWADYGDFSELDAFADAWDDDILRQDVYDENYRKELAKNAALRERLMEAEALLTKRRARLGDRGVYVTDVEVEKFLGLLPPEGSHA